MGDSMTLSAGKRALRFGWILALAVPAAAAAGDWPYTQHDMGASSRSESLGAISSSPWETPGQVFAVEVDDLDLSWVSLDDVDGDSIPDLLTPLQGKFQAFDGGDASLLWSTPVIRASDLVGVYDFDGDGLAAEVVLVAKGMTGGVFVVDQLTGGLLWSYGPLSNRSGVELGEVTVADVDGNGTSELFFAEWLYGNEYVYLADFSWGFSDVQVARQTLPGDYVFFNPSVAGAMLEPGVDSTFLVQQSEDFAVYEVCASSDPAAECSPSELFCLCERGLFEDVHPAFSSGPFHAVDLDGDGLDEVVEVLDNSRYGSLIAAFDVADGLATGAPVTEDLILWSRDYGLPSPDAYILSTGQPLGDLDGDGDEDLLVTFFDNTAGELDLAGQPADDGIDHPDGFVAAVFDVATGDLVVQIPDVVAWGVADLDGDGTDEIVTSPTMDWSFLDGIAGYTLDCTGDCLAELAWSDPTHTLVHDPGSYDDALFPEPALQLVDVGGDGQVELLAYDGDWLDVVVGDNLGGLDVLGSAELVEGEDVGAIAADGSHVLLATPASLRLMDATLGEVTASLELPGQAEAEVLAVRFDPGTVRAALVVEGGVFWTETEPSNLDDADLRTLPHVAFARDLTEDGYVELVAFAQPDETVDGSLEIETISFDPADPDGDGTPFGILWSFSASAEPSLAGFQVVSASGHGVRAADLDGDGTLEVALACWNSATYDNLLLVLDGTTGAVEEIIDGSFVTTSTFSQQVPFYVADVDDPAGSGAPDGLDDLIFADKARVHRLPGGAVETTGEFVSSIFHNEGAFGDLDGDGALDMLVMVNSTVSPKFVALRAEPPMELLWDDVVELTSLPSYTEQGLALINADGTPGLDVALTTGSGSVDLYSGATGELLAGFPFYLSQGQAIGAYDPHTAALAAMAVMDIDGDGYEEVVAGGLDGYLYGVNVSQAEAGTPSLEFSTFIGVPVEQLRFADVDGDARDEIVVVGPDSTVRVYDGTGVDLTIDEPQWGECLASTTFTVAGSASGVHTVDVRIGGGMAAGDVLVETGAWAADDVVAPGPGSWQIEAVGKGESGQELAYAQIVVTFDGDEDGDGATLCGGDCDDTDASLNLLDEDGDGVTTCDGDCDDLDPANAPDGEEVCDLADNDCDGEVDEGFDEDGDGYSLCADPLPDCDDTDELVHPGAQEICEDGIDNDCDGEDMACDVVGDDDDTTDPETPEDCSCSSADTTAGAGSSLLLLAGFAWLIRRRR